MYQFTPHHAKDAARSKGNPFCKVCFDAGKPESEYTSHYLKSSPGPTGKLVCPTLLNQSCLTCGKCGHTSSYCDQSKSRVKKSNNPNNPTNPNNPNNPNNPTNQINAITVLSIGASIGAEAELKLIASTFRSNHFPPLKAEQPKAEQPKAEEKQADPSPHLCHVYNPKSNPFGALCVSAKQHCNKKSFQPPTTTREEKPLTMAERFKNPPKPAPAPPKPAPTAKPDVPGLTKPKFADMPPKSQFWWQDEDD